MSRMELYLNGIHSLKISEEFMYDIASDYMKKYKIEHEIDDIEFNYKDEKNEVGYYYDGVVTIYIATLKKCLKENINYGYLIKKYNFAAAQKYLYFNIIVSIFHELTHAYQESLLGSYLSHSYEKKIVLQCNNISDDFYEKSYYCNPIEHHAEALAYQEVLKLKQIYGFPTFNGECNKTLVDGYRKIKIESEMTLSPTEEFYCLYDHFISGDEIDTHTNKKHLKYVCEAVQSDIPRTYSVYDRLLWGLPLKDKDNEIIDKVNSLYEDTDLEEELIKRI